MKVGKPMNTPYVTVDVATEISNEVFEETMLIWKNFCIKHGYSDVLNNTKDLIFSKTVIWRKFGFRSAGRTCRVANNVFIEMNINYLYSASAVEFIKHTLIHELAHLFAYKFNGSWGHDKTWKTIARILGDDASRCHDYAVPENKPARKPSAKRERTKFVCPNCKRIHMLTPLMQKRIAAGGYQCVCGQPAKTFVKSNN